MSAAHSKIARCACSIFIHFDSLTCGEGASLEVEEAPSGRGLSTAGTIQRWLSGAAGRRFTRLAVGSALKPRCVFGAAPHLLDKNLYIQADMRDGSNSGRRPLSWPPGERPNEGGR